MCRQKVTEKSALNSLELMLGYIEMHKVSTKKEFILKLNFIHLPVEILYNTLKPPQELYT